MKRVLNFYKILFAYLFFLYIFSSCNDASNSNRQKTETNNNLADDTSANLLTAPIHIVGYDSTSGNLALRVNGSNTNNTRVPANASRNEVKNWMVKDSLNLEIIEILPDSNYINFPGFFSTLPHQQGSPQHWQAQIANLDNKGYVEKYWIKWRIEGTTQVYTFDPLMQVNPIK